MTRATPAGAESESTPVYRPQRRLLRVAGTALLFFAFGVPFVLSAGSMLYQGLVRDRPAHVTIENQTGLAFVAWGSTEPAPRPTGDFALARLGFAIKPHGVVMLPNDRVWESVAIYTADCDFVAEEGVDGPSRFVIAEDGSVTILGSAPADQVEIASSTDDCTLVPYMPFTVPPL